MGKKKVIDKVLRETISEIGPKNKTKLKAKPETDSNGKKHSFWKIFFSMVMFLGIAGIAGVAGLFLYYAKDLPNPGKINKRIVAESTKIYDRTGEHLLYEIHGEEKRTLVPASDILDSLKYATISLEDQGFYSHYGVDLRGIMRAGVKDVLNMGAAQGGSTITQQFIKKSVLTDEKSISRKIKEVILALEVERKFSKDEIIQMYLNEIPYGSNCYGIEAAALTFFGVHAKELTLAQSALLASLPQAPSFYSPYGFHTDRLLARWKHALNQMRDLGYITPEEAENAKNEDILAQIKPVSSTISAPHFVLYVKEQLMKEFGEDIETKGYKVYTTLDWKLQQIAENAVKEGVEKNGAKYNFANAALVANNPRNGQVLAMVGSKDYFGKSEPEGCVSGKNCNFEPRDNVAIRSRQPGSSFKPYVYAESFRKGYTPETILFDADINFSDNESQEYRPKNYNNQNRGSVKMKDALAMSLNVPAVEALYLAGVDDSIKLARSMGITTLEKTGNYGLALVLGGGEVKLLDHTSAFSTFLNQGTMNEKSTILRVEETSGKVLKSYETKKSAQVLEKNVALEICDILSNNSLRAPVFGSSNNLVIPGRQVAAKTGTTNDWHDGWLVGGTPSLAAGVWAGNNDNEKMAPGADGSYVAGPIWNAFMTKALENSVAEEFEKPEIKETGKAILDGKMDLKQEVEVCKIDDGKYCLANDKCPGDDRKKKKFYNAHSILYYVDREEPLGDYPKHPEEDPQFDNWEKGVKAWIEHSENKDDINVMPRECKSSDFD